MTSGFDPAWKGGHVAVTESGVEKPARIIARDAKGPRPHVALILEGETEFAESFTTFGTSPLHTLRNAPAPKASGVDWVVRWDDKFEVRNSWVSASEEGARQFVASYFAGPTSAKNIAIIRVPWTEGEGLAP